MKQIFTHAFLLFACLSSTHAQTLFGTTSNGGELGGGSIYKLLPSSKQITTTFSFPSVESDPYYSNLISASDGKMYGMTSRGGRNYLGTIFSFTPSTKAFQLLHEFDNTHGSLPYGSLLQAKDGKLYGLASNGGSNFSGHGVIFSFDISTLTYTALHNFKPAEGAFPQGNLIEADDGKLYGTTRFGGSRDWGVVFSFDPVSSTYQNLFNFDNANGRDPIGSLIQAHNGLLYGTTSAGGRHTGGVIFSYDPAAASFRKLHDFDVNKEGRNPTASLIQPGTGKIYGVTPLGGSNNTGVMFSFDPDALVYTEVYDFDAATGINPYGSLALGSDGNLYGMTERGGNKNTGVIFSFAPSTLVYSKLKDFEGLDGALPKGGLLEAGAGVLYGMTSAGGRSYNNHFGGGLHPGFGTLFSIDQRSAAFTKLKDLGTNETGSDAKSSLILAKDKKLYGVTNAGGANGAGVLYSMDPTTSAYTKLKDFDNTDGSFPRGSLLQASDNKLYGMTAHGGRHRQGVIYCYDPATSTFSKLKDFERSIGTTPYGSFIEGDDGKLYGLTGSGGNYSVGVLFSFDPSTLAYSKLFEFTPPLGSYPNGMLTRVVSGRFYGMTSNGGAENQGVIFSFDPASLEYVVIKHFSRADGSAGTGTSLLQGKDGRLYGMTRGGGTGNTGFIFSLDLTTSSYTNLHQFDPENGMRSNGNIMEASDGKLYGTTEWGGKNDAGVIFSFDPLTLTYTKLNDFVTRDIGKLGNTLIEVVDCSARKKYYRDVDNDRFGDAAHFLEACSLPAGYAETDGDCNDAEATIYPGATEICNGKDDDCDGIVDEGLSKTFYRDEDKDGYGDPANAMTDCSQPDGYVYNDKDCNDRASTIYPGVVEICNGVDDNCNGLVDEGLSKTYYRDADNDGYGDPAKELEACSQPNGYVANSRDCNDANKAVYPGATEVCNGSDDNCDGEFDEGFPDTDRDKLPDCMDPDDDNDGEPDFSDCAPLDKKNNKVLLCHKGNTICVSQNAASAHLNHGDSKGPCSPGSITSNNNNNTPANKFSTSKSNSAKGPQYSIANYPNPFGHRTTIRYELPFDSKVSIKVYDVLGRLVTTLVDSEKKAGNYTVDYSSKNASSGSLFYRMVATSIEERFETMKKMVQHTPSH